MSSGSTVPRRRRRAEQSHLSQAGRRQRTPSLAGLDHAAGWRGGTARWAVSSRRRTSAGGTLISLHHQLHQRIIEHLVERRLRAGASVRAFRRIGVFRPRERVRPPRKTRAAPATHHGQARLCELIDRGKDMLHRRHSYASPQRPRRSHASYVNRIMYPNSSQDLLKVERTRGVVMWAPVGAAALPCGRRVLRKAGIMTSSMLLETREAPARVAELSAGRRGRLPRVGWPLDCPAACVCGNRRTGQLGPRRDLRGQPVRHRV